MWLFRKLHVGFCFVTIEPYLVSIAQASGFSTWLSERVPPWIYTAHAYIDSILNSNKSPRWSQKPRLAVVCARDSGNACKSDVWIKAESQAPSRCCPGRHERNELTVSLPHLRGTERGYSCRPELNEKRRTWTWRRPPHGNRVPMHEYQSARLTDN